MLFGKQFVTLWVGGELGEEGSFQSWMIALMIMVAYTLPLVQGFGNSILEAKNKLKFKAVLYLSFMVLGTILGAVLAHKYEAIGMMAGSVIAWIIVQNVMNFYYHKKIGLNIPRFFKELLNKTFLTVIAVFAIGYLINLLPFFGNGWLNFIAKAIPYTIVFSVIMYYTGLIEFEKALFKNTFSKILKR
jgi:hypothetical protein